MGNMKISAAAAQFNGSFEDHDCGSAIDIVIAVNENAFSARDRCFQSFDGATHPHDRVRRV